MILVSLKDKREINRKVTLFIVEIKTDSFVHCHVQNGIVDYFLQNNLQYIPLYYFFFFPVALHVSNTVVMNFILTPIGKNAASHKLKKFICRHICFLILQPIEFDNTGSCDLNIDMTIMG